MKVIFQSSVPFRFSFRLMICDFSLAGCELWIGRTIHDSVALPRVWEPGSLSESAKLGRSFLGRGYPCCFGGVTVAVFLLPVTLPPFRNSHCIGVWGVLLTTDLSGYCCYRSHRKERRGGKIYLGSRFKVAVHVVEGAWW